MVLNIQIHPQKQISPMMFDEKSLNWLDIFSQWYMVLPLTVIIFRWKTFDIIHRRVSYYVFFNIGFAIVTKIFAELKINNYFLFYFASPLMLWFIYRIFEPSIGMFKMWIYIKMLVVGFAIFVLIDMIWIEDFLKIFPENIYPPQEIILLFIIYYYLYVFSKEARQDFSLLFISIGIGLYALIILFILIYNPYLGFVPNTLGYFIWAGIGSFAEILTNSFISYGLYIARPKSVNQ